MKYVELADQIDLKLYDLYKNSSPEVLDIVIRVIEQAKDATPFLTEDGVTEESLNKTLDNVAGLVAAVQGWKLLHIEATKGTYNALQ